MNKNSVIFSKFFSEADASSVVEKVGPEAKKVVFIDTASTPMLVETIKQLRDRGVEVIVRDHHDCIEPKNQREQEIADMAKLVRTLANDAIISTREAHPACSQLISAGEFNDADAIVADSDADGLLGSMKALGIVYPELDADAAVLDGPRAEQTPDRLSTMAMLLVRGMATLPPFNPTKPELSVKAKVDLFVSFMEAVEGNVDSLQALTQKVSEYEAGVSVAKKLLESKLMIAPGVVFVDTVGAERYDLSTLTNGLESSPGCKITVIRKDNGPIAAAHGGIQYSLAVVKSHQAELNLQSYLEEGFISSPQSGIISNTSFLLHLNEENYRLVEAKLKQ